MVINCPQIVQTATTNVTQLAGRRRSRIRKNSLSTFPVLLFLIAINLASNASGKFELAGASLFALGAILLSERGLKVGWFRGVFECVLATIFFAYAVQIAGEIIGRRASTPAAMSGYLIMFLVVTQRNRVSLFSWKPLTTILGLSSAVVASWLYVASRQLASLVNFLGYGYDNYAHIAQSKLIIENSGTSFLSRGTSWPTFLHDSAQAASSLIATVTTLVGGSGSDPKPLLAIMTTTTVAVPLAAFAAPSLAIIHYMPKSRRFQRLVQFQAIALLFLVILTSYFSRIWFSGYYASNLATLLLVLLATYVALDQNIQPISLVVAAALIASVYPLFTPLAVALTLSGFLLRHREQFSTPWNKSTVAIARAMAVATPLVLFSVLPIVATKRSYGSSHILVDGGIEPLPTRFVVGWFVPFILAPALAVTFRNRNTILRLLLLSVAMIASSVTFYSLLIKGYVAYYPVKIVIASVFVLLVGSVVLFVLNWGSLLTSILLVYATLVFIVFAPSQKIFTSEFMGEAPNSLVGAVRRKVSVVQPNDVIQLSKVSLEVGLPMLLIGSDGESELNTRWINTLSGKWSDRSWSDWQRLRDLIAVEDWNEASRVQAQSQIMVATPDQELFNDLVSNGFMVCQLEPFLSCGGDELFMLGHGRGL